MPNKRVDNLIDKGLRYAAQQWQECLGIKNMTTNEWDMCGYLASLGHSNDEIRGKILEDRKKKQAVR
jgi:hypothetical protein